MGREKGQPHAEFFLCFLIQQNLLGNEKKVNLLNWLQIDLDKSICVSLRFFGTVVNRIFWFETKQFCDGISHYFLRFIFQFLVLLPLISVYSSAAEEFPSIKALRRCSTARLLRKIPRDAQATRGEGIHCFSFTSKKESTLKIFYLIFCRRQRRRFTFCVLAGVGRWRVPFVFMFFLHRGFVVDILKIKMQMNDDKNVNFCVCSYAAYDTEWKYGGKCCEQIVKRPTEVISFSSWHWVSFTFVCFSATKNMHFAFSSI